MDNIKWIFHSSGIDWLTLTFSKETAQNGLEEIIFKHMEQKERDGDEFKPGSALGYDGFRAGSIFYGVRADGCMLRVSGITASELFGAIGGYNVRCTRIDIQSTYKCIPGMPMWAAWQASLVEGLRAEKKPCNWPKLTHINGFGQGDTVTVGSRSSDKYGRIYDKEMESLDPDYQGCWRYEVEYKGDYAQACFEALSKGGSLPRNCESLVSSQFALWCLPVPMVAPDDVSALVLPRETTDAARRLAWLRKQVMPTIKKLLAQGYDKEIDEWLKDCYDTFVDVGSS